MVLEFAVLALALWEPSPSDAAETRTEDGVVAEAALERVAAAKASFAEGERHLAARRFLAAAAAFNRSYAAVPHPRTIYNVAYSYERAGQPLEALRAYQSYLGHSEVAPEERLALAETVADLRGQLAQLELELGADPRVRQVRVAGEVLDQWTEPVLVSPGNVEIEALGGRGEVLFRVSRVVRPGEHATVVPPSPRSGPGDDRSGGVARTSTPGSTSSRPVVSAIKASPAGGPSSRPSSSHPPHPGLRVAFWSTFGLALAGATSVAVLGGLTLRDDRLWDDRCPDPCERPRDHTAPSLLQEISERFPGEKLATNVMIGVTSAVAVAALTTGLLAFVPRRYRGTPSAARLGRARFGNLVRAVGRSGPVGR